MHGLLPAGLLLGDRRALDLEVWAERFAHPRGATVDLCASVSAGGAEVWRGRSTHLARGARAPEGAPASDVDVPVGDLPAGTIRWRVPATPAAATRGCPAT
ncbi:hypothetical protein SAMN05660657_00109 [Geodermatophilus amargosae]|uniref:Uncharacterized protein n=1 Tax=Geodermatophilus amargosae TaxID=1296565 RepID=A0A1I6X5U2_9ACTN|nr:hypothetical protein [Geodermatophilus amargosae]SFT33241.1 hypothetical protein SAMN05660657_00109 [Geodermatophilus amargosae]